MRDQHDPSIAIRESTHSFTDHPFENCSFFLLFISFVFQVCFYFVFSVVRNSLSQNLGMEVLWIKRLLNFVRMELTTIPSEKQDRSCRQLLLMYVLTSLPSDQVDCLQNSPHCRRITTTLWCWVLLRLFLQLHDSTYYLICCSC